MGGWGPPPRRLNQCFGSLFLPGLVPTADRLAVNAQSPGDLPLMEASVKKSGGSKPSPLQLFKITFDAFWITHASILAQRTDQCHYIVRTSVIIVAGLWGQALLKKVLAVPLLVLVVIVLLLTMTVLG